MQVFIRHTNTLTFELNNNDTIASVKNAYYEKTGISPIHMIFIYNGKLINDTSTIMDYNITSNSTIYMLIRMPS